MRDLKQNLEEVKAKADAERNKDFAVAADLRYYAIPEIVRIEAEEDQRRGDSDLLFTGQSRVKEGGCFQMDRNTCIKTLKESGGNTSNIS